MEITNNSSSAFAPKLGTFSTGSLSAESFSSHLVEPPREERKPVEDRQAASDDKAPETSQRHETEKEREASARERDAAERDEAEREDAERQATENEANRDAASSDGNAETAIAALTDAEEIASADDTGADNEEAVDFSGLVAEENKTAETATDGEAVDQTATATAAGPDTETATIPGDGTEAQAADETASAETVASEEEELSADTIALDISQSGDDAAKATADHAASTTAQANARPATGPATHQANANAAALQNSDPQANGLPNPLDGGFDGDADADSDGNRGLGHQAAESMADKHKPSFAATPATPANPASNGTPVQPAIPAMPAIPAQTLASLGLNTNALPADLDLDQLGLTQTGQASSSGTPQNNNPVLVRFGALPGQAQATQVPNNAIAMQIAKHVAKGVSTFEIRLDPPEMGRIDVKLELAQDGRVNAHLAVEKPETLDLLQRDAKALEQALRDAGLDANADTLNFSLQNGGSGNAGADPDAGADAASGEAGENDAVETDLMSALAARQIEAAARGGIDVSI